jgi:hypothetical protein
VNYRFGWTKVVFDGRVLFRLMFIIDLVKELCELVEF